MQADILVNIRDAHVSLPVSFVKGTTVRDTFLRRTKKKSMPILQGIDLRIEERSKIGVLGLNGSGKTTLCRLIAGHLKLQRGKISRFGRVSFVSGTSALIHRELSGLENIRLLARLTCRQPGRVSQVIAKAMDMAGLAEWIYAPVSTYSTGMQNRLVLSVTSQITADLLILDEAFGGTDFEFNKKVRDTFQESIRFSKSTIVVDHDPAVLRLFCDTGIVLREGRIAFRGHIEDAISNYTQGAAAN